MGDAAEQAAADSDASGLNFADTGMIAVLSLVAIAPVFRLDLSIQHAFAADVMPVLEALFPLLLALPLPAAYIATISKDGFRKEAAGTLVVLPFAVLGRPFAVFSAGIVLGGVMVSYKAKSIYNGRNTNWVHFKAAGSMLVLVAVVAGLVTASFYSSTPAFREDIRGNITQESVDVALEYADTAGLGNTQEQSTDGQMQQLSGMIGPLAANLSAASVQSTETIVFEAVRQTRNRDSSKFDETERTVLRTAFDTAEQEVPATVREQAETRIQEQFRQADTESASIEKAAMRQMVTPRVRQVVNEIVTDSRGMLVAAFVAAFSAVMLFKLPFEFLSALYAAVLSRIHRVLQ